MPSAPERLEQLDQAVRQADLLAVRTLATGLLPLRDNVLPKPLLVRAMAHPEPLAHGLMAALLEAGADPHVKDRNTPGLLLLDQAVQQRRWTLVGLLLDAGALPAHPQANAAQQALNGLFQLAIHGQATLLMPWCRAIPSGGSTRDVVNDAAWHTFVAWGGLGAVPVKARQVSSAQRIAVIEAFVQAGVDLHRLPPTTLHHRTILHHAVVLGDGAMVRYLLERGLATDRWSFEALPPATGATSGKPSYHWVLPAHLAVHGDRREVVEALLTHGVSFEITDPEALKRLDGFGSPHAYAQARAARQTLIALEAHALRCTVDSMARPDDQDPFRERPRERL